MGTWDLTPTELRRLWAEHQRMLSALYDIAHRLTPSQAGQYAKQILTEVQENAVQSSVPTNKD